MNILPVLLIFSRLIRSFLFLILLAQVDDEARDFYSLYTVIMLVVVCIPQIILQRQIVIAYDDKPTLKSILTLCILLSNLTEDVKIVTECPFLINSFANQ